MPSIHPYHAAYLAAAAVPIWFLLKPVVIFFLDPLGLRKYPSPSLLAAITPLWLMKETWLERRSRSVHEQHKKLGDVIRVGPNHLLFNIPNAVPDIYGHLAARKMIKDVFYDKIAGECHDIVNTRDHDDHAQRRKYLSNSFALRTVVGMEAVIQKNFRTLLSNIDDFILENEKAPDDKALFDIRRWLNYFTLDVIGDMAFGIPMGFASNGCDSKEAETHDGQVYNVPSVIEALQQGVRYAVTLAQVVSLDTMRCLKGVTRCTSWLRKITGAQDADDFENICIRQLRHRLVKGLAERPGGDFLNKILEDKDGNERALPFRQLVAESIVFMNAGSDTTVAALSSTLFYLLSNPECLKKLQAEIETRISLSDERDIIPYELVQDLPYLRACIDEALRLRPPIAYPLQRLVTSPEGAIIAGHFVKRGTVVAVPPYTIHRNEKLFIDAERYNPERWLNRGDPEQIQNLKSYNIVFSQGPRQCLGRHIAIVELQILISSLVRRYEMGLMREGQELLIFDRFNANPGPLPIRIKHRAVPK